MTSKTSFTKEEWAELEKAPFYAGSLVALSDMGHLELRKERHAAVKGATLWTIPDEAKDLIRPLYADIGKFRGDTDRLPGYEDIDDPENWKPVALQGLREVMAILGAKANEDEIAAFKEWLMYVAKATAEASREGALGLLGPRVSEKEKAALDEIRQTLDGNA
jgi:hypothetical protein